MTKLKSANPGVPMSLDEVHSAIGEIIADIEIHAWSFHRQLGDSFDCRDDQYDCMGNVGNVGNALNKLRSAQRYLGKVKLK